MLAGHGDEPKIERQIVDGGDLETQQFFGLDEVMKVGEGVDMVGLGSAVGIDGLEAGLPLLVLDVDGAVEGE